MKHRRLGKSPIFVSDICMGTMTFGSQTDEAEAFRILEEYQARPRALLLLY
jgi:aryl-alcohol dehydrogenase-like predicted oxidoreductase